MIIRICVGSSCHIKGAPELVELLQKEIAERHLESRVTLAGSFCTGKCNRDGVTIQVDDEIFVGITRDSFRDFFNDNVLKKL